MSAIIVNDKNEVFIRWYSHCDISASGSESYRSEPYFAKQTDLNKGYLFSSKYAAKKALKRIELRYFRKLAIIY